MPRISWTSSAVIPSSSRRKNASAIPVGKFRQALDQKPPRTHVSPSPGSDHRPRPKARDSSGLSGRKSIHPPRSSRRRRQRPALVPSHEADRRSCGARSRSATFVRSSARRRCPRHAGLPETSPERHPPPVWRPKPQKRIAIQHVTVPVYPGFWLGNLLRRSSAAALQSSADLSSHNDESLSSPPFLTRILCQSRDPSPVHCPSRVDRDRHRGCGRWPPGWISVRIPR